MRMLARNCRLWLALLLVGGTGCGLLDVSDPTAIEEDDLANTAAAALLRGDALGRFSLAVGDAALETGLLTDEFVTIPHSERIPTSRERDIAVDRRAPGPPNQATWYVWLSEVRRAATVASYGLVTYGSRAHVGEMMAVRGHATLRLAENFCPGFPITELLDFQVVAGSPVTTNEAFERALADFDTALTFAADSARILNFARVGRAAALLGLGRFEEAAAAAAEVPTPYTWHAPFTSGSVNDRAANPLQFNRIGSSSPYTSIADGEGGNGLDFLSARDPRAQARLIGTTDQGVPLYNPAKDSSDVSPIAVASGIEARLIQAEAALQDGDPSWLTIINELRQTVALPDATEPSSDAARVDLLFRERAFWLFATGKRLGDLRRLVRLYGRDPESVFPAGAYHQGGVYGSATSFPFLEGEAEVNPAVTGCIGP